jgi:hypothetical protein
MSACLAFEQTVNLSSEGRVRKADTRGACL